MKIHGSPESDSVDFSDPYYFYGTDEEKIQALIRDDSSLGEPLHADYPYRRADVVWATRHEMARTVEDFLARRVRVLFLDARAAVDMAEEVADLMAEELGKDAKWKENQVKTFVELANRYLLERYELAKN
jgi:glycerol-3-phosphate dehydrogenase